MTQLSRQWIMIAVGFLMLVGTLWFISGISGVGDVTSTVPENAPGYSENAASGELPTYDGTPTPSGSGASASAEEGASTTLGSHVVAAGDTLAAIASAYGVAMTDIINTNGLTDPNRLDVGQKLLIPGTTGSSSTIAISSDVKLIPDSELIYGPNAQGFDIGQASVIPTNSYLRTYQEDVEGISLDGVAIVQLVADRARVHPRLLLAVLEYRSGWVTQTSPPNTGDPTISTGGGGLYRQLEWAANKLNLGYYGRRETGLSRFQLSDGSTITVSDAINHGTVAVQHWLAGHVGSNRQSWQQEVGRDGFFATYMRLFGDPFAYSDESSWDVDAAQPALTLPWEDSETWYFTGGPHGGWISGSAWAALDFVPPGQQGGCYTSDAWVTAVADGIITRISFGAVVLDLDGDGYSGSGWAIVYQHIASDSVQVSIGQRVQRGDRIGHPSCEGGFSTGTHLHIARTYNGRWISADSTTIPFNMAGWSASGTGSEYNGNLIRNDIIKEANVGRFDFNAISVSE